MRNFYHAGDIGDVIYGLCVVKALGGGDLLLGERTTLGDLQPRTGITQAIYANMILLLKHQPYVSSVRWMLQPPFVTHDLNNFRLFWKGKFPRLDRWKATLLQMHCEAFGVAYPPTEPWLYSPACKLTDVVIARSPRQHDSEFPWCDVVDKYKGRVGFVGLAEEHDAFQKEFKLTVPKLPTLMLSDVAKVIAGCKLFVGNSSSPLAIADGLRKRILQETSTENLERAHTLSYRPDHVNWNSTINLPDV